MRLILPLILLISLSGHAQWKDYILNGRGDTLNRLDMSGKKQGPWTVHVDELRGERGYEEEGYYQDDLKEGVWKKYSLEGVKIAEENYRWGKLDGRCKYFSYNGGLIREESWRAMDPKQKFDTVNVYDLKDPSRIINTVVVKNDGIALKHGKWFYYDPTDGRMEKTENWVMNKLQTDENSLVGEDDDLKPIDLRHTPIADSVKSKLPKPDVIKNYEKKNSGKKSIKVRDGATGY